MPTISALQRHIAWASIAPTTLRKMVSAGGRSAICQHLARLEVGRAALDNYGAFLNQGTQQLMAATGCRWGPARKALNLFMRDMAYNHWIRFELGLAAIEEELELPLDGRTMKRLRSGQSDICLPRCAVVDLTEEISQKFQMAAAASAQTQGMARVHLDLEWWSPQ